MMDIDFNSVMAALVASAVGFVFFSYGRKMKRMPQTVGGMLLMVYPYLVTEPLWMGVTGVLIVGLIALASRMGL